MKQSTREPAKRSRSVCVTSIIRLQTLTEIDTQDITCQYHPALLTSRKDTQLSSCSGLVNAQQLTIAPLS